MIKSHLNDFAGSLSLASKKKINKEDSSWNQSLTESWPHKRRKYDWYTYGWSDGSSMNFTVGFQPSFHLCCPLVTSVITVLKLCHTEGKIKPSFSGSFVGWCGQSALSGIRCLVWKHMKLQLINESCLCYCAVVANMDVIYLMRTTGYIRGKK